MAEEGYNANNQMDNEEERRLDMMERMELNIFVSKKARNRLPTGYPSYFPQTRYDSTQQSLPLLKAQSTHTPSPPLEMKHSIAEKSFSASPRQLTKT